MLAARNAVALFLKKAVERDRDPSGLSVRLRALQIAFGHTLETVETDVASRAQYHQPAAPADYIKAVIPVTSFHQQRSPKSSFLKKFVIADADKVPPSHPHYAFKDCQGYDMQAITPAVQRSLDVWTALEAFFVKAHGKGHGSVKQITYTKQVEAEWTERFLPSELESATPQHLIQQVQAVSQGSVSEIVEFLQDVQPLHLRQTMAALVVIYCPAQSLLPALKGMLEAGLGPNCLPAMEGLSQLVRIGRTDEALEVLKTATAAGIFISAAHFGMVGKAYGDKGDSVGVWGVIQCALANGLYRSNHLLQCLVKSYCVVQNMASALQLVLTACHNGWVPNDHVLRTLIGGYARVARSDMAAAALEDLVTNFGVQPSAHLYGALIYAHAEAKEPEAAHGVLLTMIERGVKPTVECYNSLLRAWGVMGNLEEMHALIVDMSKRGVRPNEVTWIPAMDHFARIGLPDKVRLLLDQMVVSRIKPNVVHYTVLTSAYSNMRDFPGALAVLTEMREAGISPNSRTYTAIIQGYSVTGQYPKAQALFEDMRASGIGADSVTLLSLSEGAMEQWWRQGREPEDLLTEATAHFYKAVSLGMPIFNGSSGYKTMIVDLHGYSHWNLQMVLCACLLQLMKRRAAGEVFVDNLQVIVGKGRRSFLKNNTTRDVAMRFLQSLVPVKLAKGNDGMLVVRRIDLVRVLDYLHHSQYPDDISAFKTSFIGRPKPPEAPPPARILRHLM